MTSYENQLSLALGYHNSVDALQNVALNELQGELNRYLSGEIDIGQLKERLKATLTGVFQASSELGDQHVSRQLGVVGWRRFSKAEKSAYLFKLKEDVRRNLNEFVKADSNERRKIAMHLGMSFSNAAQKGYNESIQEGSLELETSGFEVVKVWKANFIDNDPCDECRKLHGTQIKIDQEFEIPNSMKYADSYTPPLHPRCKCKIIFIVSDLSNPNKFELDAPDSTEKDSLTTQEVKEMKPSFFDKIVQGFRKVKEFFKRRRNRGR